MPASRIPMIIRSVRINHAHMVYTDFKSNVSCICSLYLTCAQSSHVQIVFESGDLAWAEQVHPLSITGISGTGSVQFLSEKTQAHFYLSGIVGYRSYAQKNSFVIDLIQKNDVLDTCELQACSLDTCDKLTCLYHAQTKKLTLSGQAEIASCLHIFDVCDAPVSGECEFMGKMPDISVDTVQGSFRLSNLTYNGYALPGLIFDGDANLALGDIDGTLVCDTKSFDVSCKNVDTCIKNLNLAGKICFSGKSNMLDLKLTHNPIKIQDNFKNIKVGDLINAQAQDHTSDLAVDYVGKISDINCALHACFESEKKQLKSFSAHIDAQTEHYGPISLATSYDIFDSYVFMGTSKNKKICKFALRKKTEQNTEKNIIVYDGNINFDFFKDFLRTYNIRFSDSKNHENVRIFGLFDDSVVTSHISLSGVDFLFPNISNGIRTIDLDLEYNFALRTLTFDKSFFRLHKGKIVISPNDRAYIMFDEQFLPTCFFIPLKLYDCFVHWKADCAAWLNGFLCFKTVQKKQEASRAQTCCILSGKLDFDKGHVYDNILSKKFGSEQFGLLGLVAVTKENSFEQKYIRFLSDLQLDVALKSVSPVLVKTPFLSTYLAFDLMLKNTGLKPLFSGVINLNDGTLNFPYHSLNITHGKISFLSHERDPMIELHASSRVQKYQINMHVSGLLSQPHILFESSPSLSQAQIITLLLGGCDDGSLYLAMPFVLSQALDSLLFGRSDSLTHVQRQLTNLFSPLKNVRIIPRIGKSELTSSGARGSLLLEIGDNLRASVQRPIGPSDEQTRIDLEYGLRDDLVLRAVKDEHGDIGAELEKTWKFS